MLLLARFLPPAINSGIYRPTEVLRVAARRGWRVTTVSKSLDQDPTPAGLELANTLPGTVRLERFDPPAPHDASHYFSPRISGGFETIDSIIQCARRACQSHPPAVVMASGPPFAEFVAALALSREWGASLVLDYRDEWTQCPFPFVGVGNSDWFWEPRCLRAADLVFFTTESQRQHQIQSFPQLAESRTRVAPNGWNDPSNGSSPAPEAGPDVATIAFVGLLGEHCDLPEFLGTLEQAVEGSPEIEGRVQFLFVGTKTRAEEATLQAFSRPGLVRDIRHVPLSEAQRIMQNSSALLLFNTPRLARYLPGKVYDYIATGQRVLLYGEGGELDRLMADYPPAIRVSRGDPEQLLGVLHRIAGGLGPPEPVSSSFLERCRRSANAEAMIIELENLLARRASGDPVT